MPCVAAQHDSGSCKVLACTSLLAGNVRHCRPSQSCVHSVIGGAAVSSQCRKQIWPDTPLIPQESGLLARRPREEALPLRIDLYGPRWGQHPSCMDVASHTSLKHYTMIVHNAAARRWSRLLCQHPIWQTGHAASVSTDEQLEELWQMPDSPRCMPD